MMAKKNEIVMVGWNWFCGLQAEACATGPS